MTMAMGMIAGLWANVTDHQPPAPLPEFKTPEQLAKWRTEQSQKTQTAAPTQEGGVFYTGKPYLAESGSYAFKYREYNPEMGRWTTVDPSGFPDGANNRMYAAVPTSELDPNGCVSFRISASVTYSNNIIRNGNNYTEVLSQITSVNPSQTDISLLSPSFPTYNFSLGNNSLPGYIDIYTYKASNRGNNPSVAINFNYYGTPGGSLAWIQIATKTSTSGQIGPFIDNGGASDPFYPNAIKSFSDNPAIGILKNNPAFSADTYAAIFSGHNVTLYGGIRWGASIYE
jgi:RHS repeat-associated protein